MTRRTRFCRLLPVLTLFLGWLGGLTPAPLPAQEFRALWADGWNSGLKTATQVSQLVADARAGNFNAVVVQVRRRGDVLFNSNYEPRVTDVASDFDPLADLIAKAHNTNTGPRLEVHAWVVTFPIWNSPTSLPPQTNHPFRLHPDWLSRTDTGTNFVSGVNYQFDPGHPGVLEHTFNVCLDLITRYDVDGLNFDYIRYDGNQWGYNPVAVERFNRRHNRAGQPSRTDAAWLQWRREQVGALVRKVYLHAIAVKPHVKISADTITWAPGPATAAAWTSSAAYTSVLQDWRAWMEEGILDLNIPMAYFDQGGAYAYSWTNWNNFAKDHRYNRHVAIGPGIYLNSTSNALVQMRYARVPSAAGQYADGVCGYSYAVPNDDSVARTTFLAALTQTNVARLYDPNPVPLFQSSAAVPAMPWKVAPTRGHLKGVVLNGTNGAAFDAATILLNGPTNRVMVADGTGFYGAVDLPPGSYTVVATNAGFLAQVTNVTIAPGVVSTRDFTLPLVPVPPPLGISNVTIVAGARAAIVTWTTTNATTSQVEFGLSTNLGTLTPEDPRPVLSHAVLLAGLEPGSNYHLAVISRSGLAEARSAGWSFASAGELIVDNTEATYTGSWSTGTSAPDKFGADYRFATVNTNGNTASALFTPRIATRGGYDVFLWYPQGANRSTNAQVTVYHHGGSFTTRVNQETGGGAWRQVATNLLFLPGTNSFVRIGNFAGDDGNVVMSDAVRFVYRADQDTPVGPTVPDWWAFHYFGANTNALADTDGDGYPNWAEYLTGTIPTNAASRLEFVMDPADGAGGAVRFGPWTGGRSYRLQERVEPAGWLTLTNLPVAVPGTGRGRFPLAELPAGPVRIYRLQVDWE